MPYCDILQGLPGSGKSEYAKVLGATVCSADSYFVGADGTYNFNPALLGAAHRECMPRFLTAVHSGLPVCIDNTNTSLEEMVPYVRVAQAMGYIVHVHTLVCSVSTSVARNTHSVPRAAIERMYRRMATPPKRWDVAHFVVKTD